MAIPANFDISYYSGDRYEFYINAKDSEGNDMDLSAYTANFIIADARGGDATVSAVAEATIDGSQIICVIPPTVGASLTGTTYVYDVNVANGTDYIYTYLTGSITVTQDVVEV